MQTVTNAQQKATVTDSTKIGLVLSGGGAKGFAHIGVLKVIDSLGIKVDYVAGTSMGAIVGSLYASGYSGKQLDSIFKSLNFDDIVNDNIPREAKSFFQKNNDERYIATFPFDGFKINLPSAISRGQNVYNLLSQLTLHVSNIHDFSKLPIPFFCIATNVETGKPVILERGNLAKSIQASGAFPSLFQPVELDGQLLIDGGVVDNYPIEELKSRGAEYIIGVDVQDDLATREELKAANEILLQINNYRTIEDMVEKSKLTDIHIKPDITNYSVISFSEGKDIVANGEKAALKKIDLLKKLVFKSKKNNQGYIIKPVDSIHLNSINFSRNKGYSKDYLLGKLKLKTNRKIAYKDFIKGVNNIIATDNFDAFSYQFKKNLDNSYNLTASAIESPQKMFLKVGLHYDDLYKSSALVNLTRKNILRRDDVATLDIILGDNIRYNFEYLVDKGYRWSFGLNSRYNTFHRNIDADLILTFDQQIDFNVNKVDTEIQDFTNQIYFQTLFQKDFLFRLGTEHKYLRLSTETLVENQGDRDILFDNSDYLSAFAKLKLDTYDDIHFPRSGFYAQGDFNWYFSSSNFNKNFSKFSIAKADLGFAFPISKRIAMNISTQGGFKIDGQNTNTLNFAFGGYGKNFINNINSFYGYDYLSLSANSFVKANVNLDYEFIDKNHFRVGTNFANIENDIFETGEWLSLPDYSGFALGYSLETFIGPVEATYTFSPEIKRSYWFFNVGFWF